MREKRAETAQKKVKSKGKTGENCSSSVQTTGAALQGFEPWFDG
jgi:hypothetical protein